ncbi:MAG: Ig-like domain-containing protein [Bacilli bacterium]|nr:Ig-like domain-containing protein [Bacilli bacterium]
MKNNSLKKLILLIPSVFMVTLTGCGGPKSEESVFVPITGIEFRTEVSSVYVNHETYITGVRVLPENASKKELAWSVEDQTVASITEDGRVEGLKPGSTKLIASAKDGSNVKKEVAITVKPLEKPSSWSLDTAYCFYYTDSFEPNITMYPTSQYIDKSVDYEVVEGADVLKVEDGKIGAYKAGTGKVKVTSKANPELVGEINCIADGDLLSKYRYKEVAGEATASVVASLEDRVSILDFKATVQKGNWAICTIEFDKKLDSKEFSFTVDSKSVSGAEWYSVRLANEGVIYSETEMGAEGHGGKPSTDHWTTNAFDFSSFDRKFNQIVICINGDSDYQEGKTDRYAEMLFDNLSFQEYVDNPTAISVKGGDVLLPLNETADIEVEFTPSAVRNRGLTYSVKPGYEEIVSVENGKLKGLSEGVGYVEVASSGDPNVKTEAKVIVSSEKMIALEVIGNDGMSINKYASKEGRTAVTSLSAPSTIADTYPSVTYKLPQKAAAKNISISVDAKMMSGLTWFSITACSNNGTARIEEIGCGDGTRDWKTFIFNYSSETEVDSIRFTINTQKDVPETEKTEILFNNLSINIG